MTESVADPFDLLAPSTRRDPYAAYRRLQQEDPVHWSRDWNAWLITRYDDAVAAFKDRRLSANRSGAYAASLPAPIREQLQPLIRNLSKWTLLLDPPDHTRLRSLISKAFTPRAIDSMRPRIQTLVDEMLDRCQGRESIDVIRDLAYPLPTVVIGDMLGMPSQDWPRLKSWSDALAAFLGASQMTPHIVHGALTSVVEMEAYLRAVIADHRHRPRENLMTLLLNAEESGQVLDEQELLASCVSILFGGHETTTNLIGNGALALSRHPDELRNLRDAPELISSAVEEFLRFDSPVQRMGRVAAEDVELRGKTLRKGQRVFMVMGAANRDPTQFSNPDRLDISRTENRHLSLGLGIHYCVGAALGRIEGQVALSSLVRRMPKFAVDVGRLEWLENLTVRGVKSLPMALA